MPSERSYPEVYVEETPNGVRAIKGVPTSVAAFVGYTVTGPVNTPVPVSSLGDFTREFGNTDQSSDVSYAVDQFFTNGGKAAWVVRVIGSEDPAKPSPAELIGSANGETGMHALETVDLFNLLLVPNRSDSGLHAAMISYAEKRRAFAILDLPTHISTVPEAQAWLAANAALKHANAAVYFPRVVFSDPAQNGQPRPFANCAAVAGIYARTDEQRGVWKAPAGQHANVIGAVGLETQLSDVENGVMNPLGLNAIRHMPAHGTLVWGSRTLAGADENASQWKYVPVRRTALFLGESLARGLSWTIFEANGEPLWSQVRASAGAFMHTLFRQGAFQGQTPAHAYFVKCDSQTTSEADISAGRANLHIGFAPLKPAEFIVLQLELGVKAPD